jgi:hypothetical protein
LPIQHKEIAVKKFILLCLLLFPTLGNAQAPTKAQLDSVLAHWLGVRAQAVSSRGFIRGSETQLTKVIVQSDSAIAYTRRLIAAMGGVPVDTAIVLPPVDTIPDPEPPDTIVPPPPTVGAVSNVSLLLRQMNAANIGIDVHWNPVAGATTYELRSYYGTDPINVPWKQVPRTAAMTHVSRQVGQTHNVCVRAIGGPETCVTGVTPDIDSTTIVVDSTSVEVGSTVTVCAYGWSAGKVIPDLPVVWESDDPAIATVVADISPAAVAACLAKLPANKIWPKPNP